MSRGFYPQQHGQQQEARTKNRHLQWSTLGFIVFKKARDQASGREKRQPTRHTANSQLTSTFAREALETGKALIDCGATRFMGSWDALECLASVDEQRHGSTLFPWIAKRGRGTQNACGRTDDCKINCSNTTGVPISFVCAEFVTNGNHC